MDFGELEPKGVVVARWRENRMGPGLAFNGWRFEPLHVPAMFQIEGELSPFGFTYRIVGGSPITVHTIELGDPLPTRFTGADVRVRYTYKRAEAAALNVAHIHAEFAEARSLKIEAVPAQDREIRAPDVVAAPTLVAKLEAYARRQGLEWTPALAGKAAQLDDRPCADWQHEALSRIAEIGRELLP
jgi:hypothetical protein